MKKKYLRFISMAGFVGLASFLLASCSDEELVPDQGKVVDGITFDVNDVQNMSDANSLPQTKDPSVYETQSSPLKGAGVTGLELVETTVEGVLPIQHTSVTRGLITSDANFTTINKPFAIFGCRDGSATPDFLYNEKINADGTMVNPVQWKRSDAAKLIFYAVHPAADNVNQRITTTSGQLPIISFKPNEDAKLQTDLLVAKTDEFSYETDRKKKLPVNFKHATTAIEFQIGQDLSYNQKVKTIEILGVIGEGTYDVAAKKWTLGTTTNNYKLTLNPTFSTAADIGAVMNGGDGTFFMIPQTLPANAYVKITFESGKYVQAKIGGKDKSGNDKKWVEGTTKTYTISNSKDLSDRDFVLKIKPVKDSTEYNKLNMPFTVTSYRHLKEYSGTDRDKAEPWVVAGYEYKADNGEWTPLSTTKPSMVASITERGVGGTSAEACMMTVTNDVQDFVQYRNKELKNAAIPSGEVDLSMVSGKQNTANCYIVSAPGKYKFPTYYGSSRVDDQDVKASYYNGNNTNKTMYWFKGGIRNVADNGYDYGYYIPYPDIYQQMDSATVLWRSSANLVKNVSITGKARSGYVHFEIDKNDIKMGNASIAIWKGGKIIWSWHIWVTGKDVANVKSGEFMREPIGFVPTTWVRTSYAESRQVRVTVKQPRSGKTATAIFTQTAYQEQAHGTAMFYQWGRKDPFWYGMPRLSASPNQYDGGISLTEAVQKPYMMGHNRRFYSVPAGPVEPDGHEMWGSTWDWCNEPEKRNTYVNLWDASSVDVLGNNTGRFIKTIYDPSPAGFHVPRAADFSKMQPDRRKAALRMGAISQEGEPNHNTPEPTHAGYGYYWTSEKTFVLHSTGTWAYLGVHAYAVSDTDLKIQKDKQYYTNPSFAHNVLPIKQ